MQIPQPHINIKVRGLFNKIYPNRQINLAASKNHLKEQLDLYLDHLSQHTSREVTQKERLRVWNVIERNNQVAKILSTPAFRKIVKRKRELSKGISLGYVFCIDGRIPAIFIGGRFARHFEIPAAEITTIKRKSDGKFIPDSSDLNEALRRISIAKDELLEIIYAHTSLSNPHHGCGAMMAKQKAHLIDSKAGLVEANLKIIEEKSIPAITNMYNEFRGQLGIEDLKVVCVSAVYDTETFGIILNFNLENESLSTTEITNKYKDKMDEYFIRDNLVFGSFREKFTDLKYLTAFSQNVLKISEAILDKKVGADLLDEVEQYLAKFYPDLTADQKQAFKFVLIRNIALQYLTGLSNQKKNIDHAFSKHEESYMAVAMRGATIGKFDPQNQGFASTPSDPGQAIQNINTMMSIMGPSKQNRPYILFVCNSVNSRDLKENNQVLQRIMGSNAGLLRDIVEDKDLGVMIEKGEIIPLPILIDEDTREVLKIVDHSGYI